MMLKTGVGFKISASGVFLNPLQMFTRQLNLLSKILFSFSVTGVDATAVSNHLGTEALLGRIICRFFPDLSSS